MTVDIIKITVKNKVIPRIFVREVFRFPLLEICKDQPPKSDYGSMRTNKGVM